MKFWGKDFPDCGVEAEEKEEGREQGGLHVIEVVLPNGNLSRDVPVT